MKIPCKDCITLSICKGSLIVDKYGFARWAISTRELCNKCVLLREFILNKDSSINLKS